MSGAKIIKPTVITDSILSSSSVAEPDAGEVLWNGSTAYSVDFVVIRTTTHRKYRRLVAGTTSTAPENDSVNWLDIGPTNRWAAFDRKVGTVTTASTSISYVLRPGATSGIGALELVGRQFQATLRDGAGGVVVYDKAISLDGSVITSIYDWLVADFEQLTDVVLTDLPSNYASGELTIQITGTSGVSVGVLQTGKVIELGGTLYGASVGILDYSRKDTDAFGNMDVLERSYSKHMNLQVITAKADFNKLYRIFASLRATPCIYIGVDEFGFEPMINYGFYKDFGITVSYPQHHLLNIEIEGLS